MTEYIPIFVMDEDDTTRSESMSLREFLEEIDNHVKNADGANLDNVFVNVRTAYYEDDEFGEMTMGEISFSVKK